MAVTTTGSLVKGLNDGLGLGVGEPIGKIIIVNGTPDAVLQTIIPSGVAWDATNAQHYMAKTGSTWIKLGSVA